MLGFPTNADNEGFVTNLRTTIWSNCAVSNNFACLLLLLSFIKFVLFSTTKNRLQFVRTFQIQKGLKVNGEESVHKRSVVTINTF